MRLTKFLKRQVSKVLCAALVLSVVAVAGERQVAEAASKTEIETYGTTLTLNEQATGVLAKEDEQDWYIFDITERGYFSIDLQINENADVDKIYNGWKISLYHEDDLINAVSSTDSVTNKYEGKELPLPTGRYYICVEASNKSILVDCEYDIKVNFTETEFWEQEYNDTNAAPNVIEVNQIYFGNFHHREDVDWYKVVTPEDGVIQMDFGPDTSTDVDDILEGWKVTVYDDGLNVIREYIFKTRWTSQVLPFQKGTFYIKVEASSHGFIFDHPEPVNCIYDLQLKFNSVTDWEIEPNGEYSKANTITSGNEYTGVLSWNSDEDWYRIDNEGNAEATLQFKVDDSVSVDDINDGWKIVVYNEDREQITEMNNIKKTIAEEGIQLPKGAVYIKIVTAPVFLSKPPIDCIYHLTVTTTPVAESGSGENSGNGSTETPDHTSVPSNTSAPGNTTTPSNTEKPESTSKPNTSTATATPSTNNQSSGTSNSVTTDNATITKAITTSKVTTSTVTSKKKKSVYLRWKKQKYAGGYEIYRSTKKKNGYKKVKTIKGGSKVSWTDKNVKGGKTYYYKIRAYRKINGKKTVSGFSKVKKVKVKK